MPWVGEHAAWIGHALLVVSVVLTLVSGAQYFVEARKVQPV